MTKENYHTEEIKDLVSQLVKITEILIEPPSSVDKKTLEALRISQYETIQNLSAITG
ncbi:hypothetical protein [Vibrio sp. 070316B]|jgi:hypothetical protein|uniref:hypothetical protein n=1 Tax=Vibrio sp. 070316B TaxID=2607608 RepID=UPI001493DDB4|nr:hypothetical protein [Vibrio sp. 070316B]